LWHLRIDCPPSHDPPQDSPLFYWQPCPDCLPPINNQANSPAIFFFTPPPRPKPVCYYSFFYIPYVPITQNSPIAFSRPFTLPLGQYSCLPGRPPPLDLPDKSTELWSILHPPSFASPLFQCSTYYYLNMQLLVLFWFLLFLSNQGGKLISSFSLFSAVTPKSIWISSSSFFTLPV